MLMYTYTCLLCFNCGINFIICMFTNSVGDACFTVVTYKSTLEDI